MFLILVDQQAVTISTPRTHTSYCCLPYSACCPKEGQSLWPLQNSACAGPICHLRHIQRRVSRPRGSGYQSHRQPGGGHIRRRFFGDTHEWGDGDFLMVALIPLGPCASVRVLCVQCGCLCILASMLSANKIWLSFVVDPVYVCVYMVCECAHACEHVDSLWFTLPYLWNFVYHHVLL